MLYKEDKMTEIVTASARKRKIGLLLNPCHEESKAYWS